MEQFWDVPFVKMHGAGNDFVVLDGLREALPSGFDFGDAAQALCARHFGAGGDGLLLLEAPDAAGQRGGASVQMRMWNPDGTEDMCGNGLRCAALLAFSRGYAKREFVTQTLAGLRFCEILESEAGQEQVRVGMGEPIFERHNIPMAPNAMAPSTSANALGYTLPVGGENVPHVSSLSTGSTHTVIFGQELPDDARFVRLSPLIEHHPWFPARTSIMWARVAGPNALALRIWERGAGETLACGTGACAAAVAAQVTGRCEGGRDGIRVQSRGGTLRVAWKPGQQMQMTGPARVVFEGRARLSASGPNPEA